VISCGADSIRKADRYRKLAKAYYQKAIEEYEGLIKRKKANDEVYFKLGKIYFEQGDFNYAIEWFKKSNILQAKKYLGISYYKNGDFTEALKIFDSLGALEDDFYLYNYALVCEKLNLFEQAKTLYVQIKNSPYYKLAQKRIEEISRIYEEGNLDSSIKRFFDKRFSKEFYPQASVLFLKVKEEFEILGENNAVYSGYFIIKILDDRGKENFSEVEINYDATYEKPYLEFARTIREDGTVAAVGKKHIRDVSRYLNFPLYSNARAMIISMPQVSNGCIIEYKFKIFKNQLINKKDFSLSYFLRESEPIIEADFSFVMPRQEKLNIKFLNEKYNHKDLSLAPQILELEDNKIRYQWHFEDMPAIVPEPHAPPLVEINPTIILSTFSKWQDVYQWWWKLVQDKIKVTPLIKETVKNLISTCKTEKEKVIALYNFCARNIRYVAVAYGQAGYEPHYAEEILLNKYGDCKDQSILLVTMLREAGFKAYPVLIGTHDYFDLSCDFPAVLFNHCIAMVELENQEVFLDPTCTTCSFGDLPLDDQKRNVLVFKDDHFEIKQTPLLSNSFNQLIHSLKIEFGKDGQIKAEKEVSCFGFYNQVQRAWLLYNHPKIIEQNLQSAIQENSIGAKLIGYKIENLEAWDKPVILKYSFQANNYGIFAGPLRILAPLSDLPADLVAKEKREYPLDLGILDTQIKNIQIHLPRNFNVKYIPANLYLDSPWLTFQLSYHRVKNIVYFQQKKVVKKRIILPQEYAEFKNFYEKILEGANQRIILEKRN